MAKNFRIEHIATTPHGWKVRTVTQGDHEVRIAFPPGRREQGSGHVVEILHPRHENPGMCPGRSRMSNPAELVLMGANPMRRENLFGFGKRETETQKAKRHHREELTHIAGRQRSCVQQCSEKFGARKRRAHRHANPSGEHFAIRWHTGSISNAYPTKAEAERVLRSFHGAGEVIRVNPLPLRAERYRNPADLESRQAQQAREIRSGFVDRETNHYWVTDEPHVLAGDYAEIGKLVALAVKPTPDGETQAVQEISFAGRGIVAISDTSRRQIFFVSGDQHMESAELRMFNATPGAEIELGECRAIVYKAKKYHPEVGNDAAGKVVEWHHLFGEETGVKPTLWYDARYERLKLKGGAYRVEDAGIVN